MIKYYRLENGESNEITLTPEIEEAIKYVYRLYDYSPLKIDTDEEMEKYLVAIDIVRDIRIAYEK